MLFLILDIPYLTYFKESHASQVESVQKSKLEVDKLAGGIFYLLSGIAYFKIVKRMVRTEEEAFKVGAMMGFLMYMSFDVVNKAIFKEYTWKYAIQDMIWGTFVFGMASKLAFKYGL